MKSRSSSHALAKSVSATIARATTSPHPSVGRVSSLELEFDHEELAALIHERSHAQGFADHLTKLHVSFVGSCPDLWVGLSVRLRKLILSASAQSRTDHALIQSQLRAGGEEGGAPHPTPALLAHDAAALEALGRWRATIHMLVAARCLSAGSLAPRMVLQTTRDSMVAHVSDLDATIGRLATAEILERDHADSGRSVEAIFARVVGARVLLCAVLLRK